MVKANKTAFLAIETMYEVMDSHSISLQNTTLPAKNRH